MANKAIKSLISNISPVSAWVQGFSPVTDNWPSTAGSKPTAAMFTCAVATFKKYTIGRESLYLAMAMRSEGVTLAQFIDAGRPWHAAGYADNHCRVNGVVCVATGGFTRVVAAGTRFMTLTAEGLKQVQARLPSQPKPKRTTGQRRPKVATPAVDAQVTGGTEQVQTGNPASPEAGTL